MQQLESEIRQFIVDSFLFGDDDPQLGNEDSLLERGVIDSTGVLQLLAFLEDQYQIQVADTELVPEYLDSIGRLARLVQRKRQA